MPASGERVLVLSASIGGGHVACAQALEAALLERGVEARHVDLLEHTALPFRRLYRQAYFDLVRNVPDLVDWLGRRLDRRPTEALSVQRRLRARVVRMLSYELPRIIDRFAPRALVHTHFLGPEVMAGRVRRRAPLPQAEVITDFFAHSLWLQPGIARYFVAIEEVKVHLVASGVDAQRVRVTGIPVDPAFARLPGQAEARERLGLRSDRDVLLVMAGGLEGDDLTNVLERLRGLRWPLDVEVVTGRSQRLARLAERFVEPSGPVRVRVHGFVADVPVRMAAADIVLTKPGGLTSSEALAAGLPLLLVSPYPLQEEANATVLLENGAALRVEPLSTLTFKLRRLLAERERLEAMRAAARRLGHPDAAYSVADAVLSELVREGPARGQA
ncbi:MAG TPA: glycosyltransferase [Trueperaceae bacterium]|nr:glycosyltransferase [Trueperaceae bacterium]